MLIINQLLRFYALLYLRVQRFVSRVLFISNFLIVNDFVIYSVSGIIYEVLLQCSGLGYPNEQMFDQIWL